MIISASRRTDIPAFFSAWFMQRLKEGFLVWSNPFNPNQIKTISLKPEDVEVIVFWSKYPKPLLKYLDHLDNLGLKHYFHFTLNAYPPVIEPHVPCLEERISVFQELGSRIGPDKVIWRYDPVLLSNVTPLEYHVDKFGYLVSRLGGYTKRVVISFADIYRKVSVKLKKLATEKEVLAEDIRSEKNLIYLESLVRTFLHETAIHNMEIFTCAEPAGFDDLGLKHGKCIDDTLINQVFSLQIPPKKDKNQRRGCLCVESVDIGSYNTCRFGCAYCYANVSEKTVMRNLKNHKLSSPSLIGICGGQ